MNSILINLVLPHETTNTMNQELVKLKRIEGVTVVTLNRPEALNALSTALSNAISSTFDELSKDDGTEVIILTGAGRAFTVGLDLKELGGASDGLGAVVVHA